MAQPERLARKTLAETTQGEVPVPVKRIAERLNISITYEPYNGDLSGMLYREGTKAIIGVNATHPSTRQRFTIAHEIGHFLLHGERSMFVDKSVVFRDRSSSLGTDVEEIEANQFAAALLMPEALVLREVKALASSGKSRNGDRLVKQLAKTFDVSPQSMQFRLANLGVFLPA